LSPNTRDKAKSFLTFPRYQTLFWVGETYQQDAGAGGESERWQAEGGEEGEEGEE
jgi:hypothetical protein